MKTTKQGNRFHTGQSVRVMRKDEDLMGGAEGTVIGVFPPAGEQRYCVSFGQSWGYWFTADELAPIRDEERRND